MKKLLNLPVFLTLLFASLLCLSSFSSVSVADVRDDNPPIEKKKVTKEQKRQQRLNKRYNRLYERFDKTTNTKHRLRLQKKIRNVERQQATNGNPVWGIIGLILGVLAFVLFVAALVALGNAAVMAASTGTAAATGGGLALFISGLLMAIAGIVISIISLALISKDPDKYSLRGFGIAGIIVGSVFALILIIAIVIFIAASSI